MFRPDISPAADKKLPGSLLGKGSVRLASTAIHQFAESLGNAIDAKDPFTSTHSEEVAEISHSLALTMHLSPAEADIIHVAGHLHDIGKIGVPDEVLRKRGPLTTDQWNEMRKHPEAGADILRPVAALKEIGVVDMVLHHHERYDGRGYPAKLAGHRIPLGARIICVADSLSAMLQNRPYRSALDFERAYDEILRCSGTQFDPQVVHAFKRSADTIREIVCSLSGCSTKSTSLGIRAAKG